LRRFLIGRAAVPAAEAEDLAQEVFLRLLRYDRAELVEHPQAYLYRVARNVAAEWSMRARNRYSHDSRWLSGLLEEELPEHQASRAEVQVQLERAIATLPPRQRQVLKLRFEDGLDHVAIAERLGITSRVVKRSLIASYAKLRGELQPEIGGITEWTTKYGSE
jgi:RNA polymerase sigma-70 factor (ECF subfamily)